jgi:hypothetical protein
VSGWDILAEARMREWLARPAADRAPAPPADRGLPLELQLMQDVARLDRMAAASTDPREAAATRRQAEELMLRLMMLLEADGRVETARHLAEQRFARRRP